MMQKNELKLLKQRLKESSNVEKSKILARFFKTGPGEYGEGDRFYGIPVPVLRKILTQFMNLNFTQIEVLLKSKIHEERLLGLLILVERYKKSKDLNEKEEIYYFYIKHIESINNWDLVDLSAPNIVGNYLFQNDCSVLLKWARNKNMWVRRIAVLATFYFIRQNRFDETLALSEILLHDQEDLIHKAVGWMLREVGKRDQAIEETFLDQYSTIMPRTMLRYAIERFPEPKRQYYLHRDK